MIIRDSGRTMVVGDNACLLIAKNAGGNPRNPTAPHLVD
jgi:hypothetical protein